MRSGVILGLAWVLHRLVSPTEYALAKCTAVGDRERHPKVRGPRTGQSQAVKPAAFFLIQSPAREANSGRSRLDVDQRDTRKVPCPSSSVAGWGNCVGWRAMGMSPIGSASCTEHCTSDQCSRGRGYSHLVCGSPRYSAFLYGFHRQVGCRSISCFLSSSLVDARHDSEARRAIGDEETPPRIASRAPPQRSIRS